MTRPTLLLRHIHLPHITPFSIAQSLQSTLVQQFLAHKALVSSQALHNPSASEPLPPPIPPPPTPTILTFTPAPTYTLGRREHDSLSSKQKALLRAPLTPDKKTAHNPDRHPEFASVEETLRGGQTTFHGPGQLVVYPILDLKTFGLGVRTYVNLLEQSTIDTLGNWGIHGVRTENPGVWEVEGERKIAALGVHLRRNVTSYGVGLNIKTDLQWFDRIVACGLEGKSVTSMSELGRESGLWWQKHKGDSILGGIPEVTDSSAELNIGTSKRSGRLLRKRLKPSTVGRSWVRMFARSLFGEEPQWVVVKARAEDVLAEIEEEKGEEDVVG